MRLVSCREFLELFLEDWLEGALPARRWRQCDRHLDLCVSCAESAAGYRTTVRILRRFGRTTGSEPLPEELTRGILARSRTS